MRIMGLDFGSHTVGVAVSDELGLTAQGVEIIRRKSPNKLRQTLARIEELVVFFDVGKIVLGYPKHLTTVRAHQIMSETGVRGEKRKEYVDEIAAMLILQGYLDARYDSGRHEKEE